MRIFLGLVVTLIGALWTGPCWADDVCLPLARLAAAAAGARQAGLSLADLHRLTDAGGYPPEARRIIRRQTEDFYEAASPEAAQAAALARCRRAEAALLEDWRRRDAGLPPRDPLSPEEEAGGRAHGR